MDAVIFCIAGRRTGGRIHSFLVFMFTPGQIFPVAVLAGSAVIFRKTGMLAIAFYDDGFIVMVALDNVIPIVILAVLTRIFCITRAHTVGLIFGYQIIVRTFRNVIYISIFAVSAEILCITKIPAGCFHDCCMIVMFAIFPAIEGSIVPLSTRAADMHDILLLNIDFCPVAVALLLHKISSIAISAFTEIFCVALLGAGG